jgi:hypothetical protein
VQRGEDVFRTQVGGLGEVREADRQGRGERGREGVLCGGAGEGGAKGGRGGWLHGGWVPGRVSDEGAGVGCVNEAVGDPKRLSYLPILAA